MRKPFLSVFETAFPIIAACPEPKPGRKPQISDDKRELKKVRREQ